MANFLTCAIAVLGIVAIVLIAYPTGPMSGWKETCRSWKAEMYIHDGKITCIRRKAE